MIVTPDASVLLKWVLPGDDAQDTDAALASLSVTCRVAFYDAAYHAVALRLGGVFVTADERYVRRASGAGGISSLRLWQMP